MTSTAVNRSIKIDCSSLIIGKEYTRQHLAKLWGYNGTQGLEKGIIPVANSNTIILFITKDKDKYSTQYTDILSESTLSIEGQERHGTDKHVIDADTVYIFYRKAKKIKNVSVPFIYKGTAHLTEYTINTNGPSKFVFSLNNDIYSDQILSEEEVFNIGMMSPSISEGTKKYISHTQYERNPKNRAEAIRIHGHSCAICGFDFDKIYGKDIASGFIEIHHIIPLSKTGQRTVNPETDLIPVCSNCHSMLHHKRLFPPSVKELKEIFTKKNNK